MEEEIKKNQEKTLEKKRNMPKMAVAALVISILAFIFAVHGKIFTNSNAMKSLNGTISNVVVPEIKILKHKNTVQTVYELKHVIITLERLREITESEEIKMQVQQIIEQVEDLSIKTFVIE